ncbi:LysE family translocator [Parasalinivibrio latis]|uniref:LysE family translocator n=1 Tax=Parasalinivibrio latis TaxID=2952610 RepID=UPI0030E12293
MDFNVWLSFVAVLAMITVIPGPSIMLLVGISISRGKQAAWKCILGFLLGTSLLMVLSVLGLGALLATSDLLFQVVKWAGVAYMAYLGVMFILEARKPTESVSEESASAGALRAGFLSTLLNPKGIVFYMAFLSQFIDPTSGYLAQFSILLLTSAGVIFVITLIYALAATKIRQKLASPRAQKRLKLFSGSIFLSGSAMMAGIK